VGGLRSVSFVEWGFRDHPTLEELEVLRKGKQNAGAGHTNNDSASTSITMVSSGQTADGSDADTHSHPYPCPPPFTHSNSHPTSNMIMNPRPRAAFVRGLKAQCSTLISVRVGDCDKSVSAWEALL
jgi:hypothetical protein